MFRSRIFSFCSLIFAACLLGLLANGQHAYAQAFNELEVFDVAVKTVEDNFFDPNAIDADFAKRRDELREKLLQSRDSIGREDLSRAVNDLLRSLNTSHTYYLTPEDTEYYRIASVFQKLPKIAALFPAGKVVYPSIGILPRKIDQRWYVQMCCRIPAPRKRALRLATSC